MQQSAGRGRQGWKWDDTGKWSHTSVPINPWGCGNTSSQDPVIFGIVLWRLSFATTIYKDSDDPNTVRAMENRLKCQNNDGRLCLPIALFPRACGSSARNTRTNMDYQMGSCELLQHGKRYLYLLNARHDIKDFSGKVQTESWLTTGPALTNLQKKVYDEWPWWALVPLPSTRTCLAISLLDRVRQRHSNTIGALVYPLFQDSKYEPENFVMKWSLTLRCCW